jgi:hypothetical protein
MTSESLALEGGSSVPNTVLDVKKVFTGSDSFQPNSSPIWPE